VSTTAFPLSRVEASNLPAESKTQIRTFYDRFKALAPSVQPDGGSPTVAQVSSEAKALVVEEAMAALTGLALGVTEAVAGSLDVKFAGHTIPIDGLVVGGGALTAVAASLIGHASAAPARNVSSAALAILTQRKARDFFSSGKGKALMPAHGEPDKLLEELKNDL
jgi:hypothetical protein